MTDPSEILQKYWGYTQFREPQLEIINSVLQGNDTLALMPTGGGKSLCFQIPGIALGGVCLVVTPLVALMKDQVEQLKKREITAAYIDAGMHWREVQIILDNTTAQAYQFLYISPERLQSERFFSRLAAFHVKLLAIDEAHCISQWGYDFRPSYLEIYKVREVYPNIPIIAVTATATPKVSLDIQSKLQMLKPNTFSKSFARANLSYSVFEVEDKAKRALEILKKVQGSSVVYVRSRKKAKLMADFLVKAGVSAGFYHAGLTYAERSLKQEQWLKSKTRVMVATNAFGMGIDKPNVRTVIHIDIPDSVEAYYQEAGRAGRDEEKAYAVAIYSTSDLDEQNKALKDQFPDIQYIKKVYQALANQLQVATGSVEQQYDFDLLHFQKVFNLEVRTTFFALKHLEQQGLILFNESFYQPSALFVPDHEILYQFQVANARYDVFVKAILRTYGGEMYTDFVTISEKLLADKLKVEVAVVVSFLNALANAGIWIYKQQKDSPQISFVNQRFAVADLPFDAHYYKERKEVAAGKIATIQHYLTDGHRCRSLVFQHYFGEDTNQTCGVCDFCIQKKKCSLHNDLVLEAKAEILMLLNAKAQLPDFLKQKLKPNHQLLFGEAIEELLEARHVHYDAFGKLKA